jgi:putative heme iron utilization protein
MPTDQHAYTGPALTILPEPTHAERTRTLLHLASIATLSTLSRKHPGFPFGSLMPFALDPVGRPLFLISNMAMHTQNIRADGRASLFVTQPSADPTQGQDPLGAARATLVGNIDLVPAPDLPPARDLYLTRHENARYWVDFADFSFFRLEILDLYYVGGFGVMGWVPASDYAHATPDPLADAAPGILTHMNADHVDAMVLLARTHAQLVATEAAMTSIDRLGFYLRLKTAEGIKGARINFPREAQTSTDTRTLLVEMVRHARSA